MKKEDFEQALKRVRTDSPKRNFKQSIQLIVTLKGLNLKKPEEQLDAFVTMPHNRGKKVNVAAFVGAELIDQAKKVCNACVLDEEFKKYDADKKGVKRLADSNDFFLGQAALMPAIAKTFGRILGPKGKMPNPKAGCVVPPNANLTPLVEKLQKTVRVQAKTAPVVQLVVGNESMSDTDLMDNIMTVYNHITHALPGEENNVRHVLLKYAMGPVIRVGAQPAAKPESKSNPHEAKAESPKESPKEEKPAKEKSKAAKPKKSKKEAGE